MKVIVIDDDRNMRESVSFILQALHHTVVAADSYLSGLQAIRDNPDADAILTDNQIDHNGSGIDVIRESRQLAPQTRIVLMSAELTPEIRTQALALGATDCIRKPYTLPVFLNALGLEYPPCIDKTEPREEV
jgi:CheY-like chemotaxis protein